MELQIDTSKNTSISLAIKQQGKILAKDEFEARFSQAEKLLPGIEKLLKNNNFELKDIKKIVVESQGSSFTALRIGIVTANALAFALKVPVEDTEGKSLEKEGISLVKPEYDREPDITMPKLGT